jgi:hypothetical protein
MPQLLFVIKKSIHVKENIKINMIDFIGAVIAIVIIATLIAPFAIAIWAVLKM